MGAKTSPLVSRWLSHVRIGEPDQCWPWAGYRGAKGYGRMRDKGKTLLAHRASWIIHRGRIPDGMFVLHRCDNPPCVNPNHLFLGTNHDNVLDMHFKGRAKAPGSPGSKNPSAKLSESDVRVIRSSKESSRFLAKRYGVTASAIYSIRVGSSWKKLPIHEGESLGLRGVSHGEGHVHAKLTSKLVASIKSADGSQSEIAKRFGIVQSTVSRIRSGKRWRRS